LLQVPRISEPQSIDDISLKEQPLADVAPEHLHAFVPGLLHDVPLMLAMLGCRDSETDAQRITSESSGEKPAISNGSFDNQGDDSIDAGDGFRQSSQPAENWTASALASRKHAAL
jgi:hypothetical protein